MDLENKMHEGDMNLDEKLDILNEAAEIVGGELCEGYSGVACMVSGAMALPVAIPFPVSKQLRCRGSLERTMTAWGLITLFIGRIFAMAND